MMQYIFPIQEWTYAHEFMREYIEVSNPSSFNNPNGPNPERFPHG